MSEQNAEINKLRERVLLAALTHVAFDGWSKAALAKACADAGLTEDDGSRLFPGGVSELVEYFSAYADDKMTAVLAEEDVTAIKMRERVATAVRVRLELLGRHREAVRHALAYFALPQHAALGVKCLARTMDAIWRAVGDESTDFSFYTKRASLAGIYSATVLYWLEDDSEGFRDTFAFLDRRLDDLMEFHKTRERITRAWGDVVDKVSEIFKGPQPRA
jgi:ubiquinone biosynthesis protein COQ9